MVELIRRSAKGSRAAERPVRGAVIVVAGPDGTGKTTVADALINGPLRDRPVLRLHHRPHVLGALSSHEGPVAEPHSEPPRPVWMSLVKVLYVYADYLIGWMVRIRPALRAGQHVLLERGWWDLVIDPRRYRLQGVRTLTSILGRLLPRPEVTLVLTGELETLVARKHELTRGEMARQLAAWLNVPKRAARPVRLDTTVSLDETVRAAAAALVPPRPRLKWVGLPRRRAARWILPVAPRKAASNGFLVYTPVTPYGRWAWRAARSAAELGALRLLPSGPTPDDAVTDRIKPHAPQGFVPAVAKSYYPGRVAVLVMDAGGAPWGLAKVAFDESGHRALEREADAVQDLGQLLPAPLLAPRLLVRRPGLLIFEAVQWTPRSRPWFLAESVAYALGRFFLAGRTSEEQGPAHGDCAPWNLLRSNDLLYLVDWADARRAAPPFYDVFHFIVQSHALLGVPKREEILNGLNGAGWVGRAISAYARGADLPEEAARRALPGYLRRSVENLDPAQDDGQRGLQARSALLKATTATE